MKNLTKVICCTLLAGVTITACKKNDAPAKDAEETSVPLVGKLDDNEISKIAKLGFHTGGAVKVKDGYIVEGDIFLTAADLDQYALDKGRAIIVAKTEQYGTTYKVGGMPRTLTIECSTKSGTTILKQNLVTATDSAIKRYNDLGLQIKFSRVQSGGDIVISLKNLGGASGGFITLGRSAAFPDAQGTPGKNIDISSNSAAGFASKSIPNFATVIAHEIGHAIGFRHTDYMDRTYSCGTGGGTEPTAPSYDPTATATYIPGTPTGPDAKSWMLACDDGTSRPFNPNDIIALKALYGK